MMSLSIYVISEKVLNWSMIFLKNEAVACLTLPYHVSSHQTLKMKRLLIETEETVFQA